MREKDRSKQKRKEKQVQIVRLDAGDKATDILNLTTLSALFPVIQICVSVSSPHLICFSERTGKTSSGLVKSLSDGGWRNSLSMPPTPTL